MEVVVYTQDGKKAGTADVADAVFAAAWNADLVAHVVRGMQENQRTASAHSKDRSEVAGGGRKPWRQKGTGRARHGSIRSPLWRSGGATFGPRNERGYRSVLPHKMRAGALFSALSRKLADGEVLFMDALSFASPKTKEARRTLDALAAGSGTDGIARRRANAALVVIPDGDTNVRKSFRNFGNVAVRTLADLNALDVLSFRYVVFVNPDTTSAFLARKRGEKTQSAPAAAHKRKTSTKTSGAGSATKKTTKRAAAAR